MQEKIYTLLNTTKKKAVVASVCGALVLGIGSGAAYAANNDGAQTKHNEASVSQQNEKIRIKMLVKNENGVISHSTDGGKTWIPGAPKKGKVIQDANGKESFIFGDTNTTPSGGVIVKKEDGKLKFSKDGGKTWSDKAPDNFKMVDKDDKSVFVKKKLIVKKENGVAKYSKDGGKTWIDGEPEMKKPFMTKKENGKVKFSIDGGKTWTEKAPEDVIIKKNEDGSINVKKKID
ncbi:sialidase family protein [Gottfriedia acidiceleris]|uniref:sialidase family protein n=1 Tax=Gottfriedia acidiceleris TaxID=371036 RepID=UPI000B43B933|nr:sialidase family protein [Gottfriedia acidiceleris]